MKILYLSDSTIPSRTANSIHVMKMCQAFAKNGHQVLLISIIREQYLEQSVENVYNFYGVDPVFQYQVFHYKNKINKLFLFPADIFNCIRDYNPDLIYGRHVLGCLIGSFFNHPVVYESHGPVWQIGKIQTWALLLLLNKRPMFKKMLVISEALKKIYFDRNLVDSNKIFVAHDGADEQADFLSLFSESDKIRIGYFGHLYPGRGIDLIIELAERLPQCEFHIVGGTEQDISFWKSHEMSDNLFFHGFVEPKQVYKYRNSCNILLAPYQRDVLVAGGKINTSAYMSPLKIFEYMSSRKAIITSDLTVLREVLNSSNAMLVSPDNLQEWVEAIEMLSNNIEFREQLAENAYKDFIETYTWQKRAAHIIKMIA